MTQGQGQTGDGAAQGTHAAEVLSEIVALVGVDPTANMTTIQDRLGQVYATAESAGDQAGMALIVDAWSRVMQVKAAADGAIDMAAAADSLIDALIDHRAHVWGER